jgi:hypothetical protein
MEYVLVEVLEKLGMKEELFKEVKIRQLKYFGHIKGQRTRLLAEDHTRG